jgi:serine/threonine-protein kinase
MSVQSPFAQWLGASVGTYRLEQVLDQSALGPVFLGRERTSGTAARLRVLSVPPAQTTEVAAAYRATLDREAAPLMGLLHPYILSLTEYGIQQGLPYLVWPHLVMRSLGARLTQSGPMDVVTTGRYVDQIATALEAAHAQNVLHRNLSAECVFMQLDGQAVVADFGVRCLLDLLGGGNPNQPFYGSLEACAPEQLLDRPVGPYTDVYALGALIYRLLTGQPVFVTDTVDSLLQQHLYGTAPSIRDRRSGLPGALDPVFARALAKDAAVRYATPGAFADAYHEVISPGRGNRVPFATRSVASRISPQKLTGGPSSGRSPAISSISTVSSPSSLHGEDDLGHAGPSQPLGAATATQATAAEPGTVKPRGLATLTHRRSSIVATALIILLFVSGGLFILDGGILLPGAAPQASAEVDFVDSPNGPVGHSDALRLSAKGLPASGSHYAAWILDQQTERVLPLGPLSGSDKTYSLDYDGDSAHGNPGTNLIGAGDKIEITLEHGNGNTPVGAVVLVGGLPPHAATHIAHLLVAFPDTPGHIGLLVGLLAQAQELNAQTNVLQNAAATHNAAAVQCSAQSVLDIIEGSHGANYHPLLASCAALNISLVGDGYGLLAPAGASAGSSPAGYLEGASDHASLAATQDDTTPAIRTHAGHVEIAVANIKGWVTVADHDALTLLKTPSDAAAATDLVAQSDHAYHGVPSSSDQQIQPVVGQAGAITAYEHGQFMATVTLAPPPAH